MGQIISTRFSEKNAFNVYIGKTPIMEIQHLGFRWGEREQNGADEGRAWQTVQLM